MRAAAGLSACTRSFFQLTDCLQGSSPSYNLQQGRRPGRAPSPAISAGMRKNIISMMGLSLLPGDSSSCSSCQLPRRLWARWPLCIFIYTDAAAAAAAARTEPGQCGPAGQGPSGHGGGSRCLLGACTRRRAATNTRSGPQTG